MKQKEKKRKGRPKEKKRKSMQKEKKRKRLGTGKKHNTIWTSLDRNTLEIEYLKTRVTKLEKSSNTFRKINSKYRKLIDWLSN